MKKHLKTLIIVTILAVLVVSYYYVLSTREQTIQRDTTSEVEKIVSMNLEQMYPSTPREVIKLYSRIIKCFYNDTYTDDEFQKLMLQARVLFDEELLKANPFDEYEDNLIQEIKEYDSVNRRITSYILAKSSEVVYNRVDKVDYAVLNCAYYLRDKEGRKRVDHEYTLRKDENGRWKILYWSKPDLFMEVGDNE